MICLTGRKIKKPSNPRSKGSTSTSHTSIANSFITPINFHSSKCKPIYQLALKQVCPSSLNANGSSNSTTNIMKSMESKGPAISHASMMLVNSICIDMKDMCSDRPIDRR